MSLVETPLLQVDYIPYIDSLADVIGCGPNLFELALKDPMLAWAVTFGPNSTYAYRLCGPHKWDGAREAILGVEERVRRPFMTRTSNQTNEGTHNFLYLFVPVMLLTVLLVVALKLW